MDWKKVFHKSRIYPLVLILAMYLYWEFYLSKQDEYQEEQSQEQVLDSEGYARFTGETMGTTYAVTFHNPDKWNAKPGVDSLLKAFNQVLSTYIPDSEISRYNDGQDTVILSPLFKNVINRSQDIHQKTAGAFDPTIMPVIRLWGFSGGEATNTPDEQQINKALSLTGFDAFRIKDSLLIKTKAGAQLDFGAIAKGYGVDKVGEYLAQHGVNDYLVEIGGEVIGYGKNPKGQPWSLGVNDPKKPLDQSAFLAVLNITNQAMATSGNYRNIVEVEGKAVSHTINPKTGKPETNRLLSATIIAPDCLTADAYATAAMVKGLEETKAMLAKRPELKGFLLFEQDGKTVYYASEGMKDKIKWNGIE